MTETTAAGRWLDLVRRREAQASSVGTASSAGYWNRRAGRTTVLAQPADPAHDPVLRELLALVHPDDAVLDVGAGGGRYAIPLARAARSLTAVEPSAGMADRLRQAAEAAGVHITVRVEPWETSEAVGDMVVCANVLTPIADAGGFIQRLAGATRRLLVIVLRQGQLDQRTHVDPLWQQVYGERRVPEPTATDALGIMRELGLPATMTVVGTAAPSRSADRETLLAETLQNLMIDPERAPSAAAQVQAYLDRTMVATDAGWQLPAPSMEYGVLVSRRF